MEVDLSAADRETGGGAGLRLQLQWTPCRVAVPVVPRRPILPQRRAAVASSPVLVSRLYRSRIAVDYRTRSLKWGMPMHTNAVAIALLVWNTAAIAGDPELTQTEAVVEVTARGSFDDVKQQLVLAIENRGLIVNHESKVGEMLERTGKDLGAANRIYVRAEVLEFCSAALSRQVMEADPRLLALCPYGVGIYSLPGELNRVHLVYRRAALEGSRACGAGLAAGRPAPARDRAGRRPVARRSVQRSHLRSRHDRENAVGEFEHSVRSLSSTEAARS